MSEAHEPASAGLSLPRSGGRYVDHCRQLRCNGSVPHFLPYPQGLPLPTCFIDGATTSVEREDTWCVPWVWDDAMDCFERGCRD